MKTNGTLVLLLVCASAQAEETLPAPTGPHKIGAPSFHCKDNARDEIETSAQDDKRELMVHLINLSSAKSTGSRAIYVPDTDALRGPWNEAQMARILSMRVHCV